MEVIYTVMLTCISLAEYYGAEGSSSQPQYKIKSTRGEVEDRKLLQLAGMIPYTEEEANIRPALMSISEEELQDML